MQVLSLVWGVLAIIGMLVAFFPCLGSFNWLNIPFAGVGLIFCIVALLKAEPTNKGNATIGLITLRYRRSLRHCPAIYGWRDSLINQM